MKFNYKLFFTCQVSMMVLVALFSQIVSASHEDFVTFECVRSFEYYAYGLQEHEINSDDELDVQWQAQSEILRNDVAYNSTSVLFSRISDNEQEIWIRLQDVGSGDVLEYGVYNATTDTFRVVSADIENLNLMADQLFVDFSGRVWGIAEQSADDSDVYTPETGYYPNVSEFFALAYFDEYEQQFKLATGEPTFTVRKDALFYTPEIRVVIDNNLQIFWLFSESSIYRYDPQVQTSTLVHTFSLDGDTRSVDIAPSGEIYFSRGIQRPLAEIMSHQANSLFVFIPDTGSVQSIDTPPEVIPNEPSLFIDQQDKLWLGPVGYRDGATGLWEIIHPDLDFALEERNFLARGFGWGYPAPVLADSGGRIWFSGRYEVFYGASGLAWYDPVTGNGCNLAVGSANIIEDEYGSLWFFTSDGTLYQSMDSVIRIDIDISVTSLCSPDPDTVRVWRVRNTNPDPVDFTWDVVGTDQTGSGTVPDGTEVNPGEVMFETQTVSDSPNTVRIFVNDIEQDQQDSVPDQCPQPPTANAGADQMVNDATDTALVTLNGSVSSE